MNNKYVDSLSILHVIGNVYKTPSILDDEKYKFLEEYFPNDFHRLVFGAIYNLHMLGNKEITTLTIDDYLSQRPKQYGIYKSNNGSEYLEKAAEYSTIETFPYYYNRVKKFTLLRMYNEKCGMDLSWLYDIDFEFINNVDKFICIGPFANDIASRILVTDIDKKDIIAIKNIEDVSEALLQTKGNIYAILNMGTEQAFMESINSKKNQVVK